MITESTLQSLIAMITTKRRELADAKEELVRNGYNYYVLAEPNSPMGKINFKFLNLTKNEVRKLDKKINRLDNTKIELKQELKDLNRGRVIINDIGEGLDKVLASFENDYLSNNKPPLNFSRDLYTTNKVSFEGLTDEQAIKVAKSCIKFN